MPNHDKIISIKKPELHNKNTSNVSCSYVPYQLCTVIPVLKCMETDQTLSLSLLLIHWPYIHVLFDIAKISAYIVGPSDLDCIQTVYDVFIRRPNISAVAAAAIVVIMAGPVRVCVYKPRCHTKWCNWVDFSIKVNDCSAKRATNKYIPSNIQ